MTMLSVSGNHPKLETIPALKIKKQIIYKHKKPIKYNTWELQKQAKTMWKQGIDQRANESTEK